MKRKPQWRRWLSVVLAIVMVCSILPVGAMAATLSAAGTTADTNGERIPLIAADVTDSTGTEQLQENLENSLNPDLIQDAEVLDPDAEVRVIIELDTENLVELKAESEEPDMSMQSFLGTDVAREQISTIETMRDTVFSEMAALGIDTEATATYTAVLSGFAATVPYGKMDEIRALEGVRSVTRSVKWTLDEPTTEAEVTRAVNAAADAYKNTSDYQGEGMVIGIIDTGLDYDHEAFANAPSLCRIQKGTLEANMTNPEISVAAVWMKNVRFTQVTGDDLYVSEKVPFAFDYADVDLDVKP